MLLEKPFTLHSEQAQALYALAKEHKVFLMEAQKALFLHRNRRRKKTIESGKIGQVKLVDIRDARPGSGKIPWFWKMEQGGGVLISNASYPLSVSQYLFGTGFDEYNGLCRTWRRSDGRRVYGQPEEERPFHQFIPYDKNGFY